MPYSEGYISTFRIFSVPLMKELNKTYKSLLVMLSQSMFIIERRGVSSPVGMFLSSMNSKGSSFAGFVYSEIEKKRVYK
jgi:hypothetical protein